MELMKGRWGEIDHFGRHEFDDPREEGTGDLIALQLVKQLDEARKRLGASVNIHKRSKGGVALDGHSRRSYHYPHLKDPYLLAAVFPPINSSLPWDKLEVMRPAMAVDLHIGRRKEGDRRVPVPYAEQLAIFHEVGFTGIGLYPGWKPWAGWHLDIRPDPLFWLGLDLPTIVPGRTKRNYIYLA